MPVSLARASLRLPLLVVATLALLPTYALCLGPARRWRRPIQILWCRIVIRLTGLDVRVSGAPHTRDGVLYVCNHVSYLDIAVLSSILEGVFVAKSDIAGWPLVGSIAKVTGTIFVDRAPARARAQREEIRARLATGDRLILFPEGTSTDGSTVAPFKSSLLDIAAPHRDAAGVTVQPVSIAYTRYAEGTPLAGPLAALYCWYGDMTLVPHVARVTGLRGAVVEVRFHPPVDPADFADRKALAHSLQATVAAGVAASHDGGEPSLRAEGPAGAATAIPPAGADETPRSAPAGR